MAAISDTRKTSNGCSVAQRIPRKDAGYFASPDYIAAIDFGTTNCSVAYILPGEMGEQGPIMLPFDGTIYRVPTAILFNKEGKVEAFGVTARKFYRGLDGQEKLDCAYFEQIKMNLQHEESINREMKVKASNGKEYYLVEVIAHILKYLKDELIRVLKGSDLNIEATEFDWVITVPAIWRARGKQMMREAGYKAGLCSRECCTALKPASSHCLSEPFEDENPEKFSLALEPESAAIFCQNMTQKQAASFCRSYDTFTATRYIIVDIGGGTLDISAHRIVQGQQPHIKVIHPPTGNDFGGTRVNKEFEKFLQKLVHDNGFERFISTPDMMENIDNQVFLNVLLNEKFEKQKKLFGDRTTSTGKLSIELPTVFMKTYLDDLKQGIAEIGESMVKLVDQELRISHEQMKAFFKPVSDGIIKCIDETLDDLQKPEKIFLVGGFGGSRYVVKAIQERYETNDIKCVVPFEPAYAVVRGAVLFKQNPSIVESRKVDATYGVEVCLPFDKDTHIPKYKYINDDGELRSNNIFYTIVEHGDVIQAGERFLISLNPSVHNQTVMLLQFYSSQEKDIFYVTGERGLRSRKAQATVIKLGKIKVQMPIMTGDKYRTVDVTFDFSHTEIKVKAFDKTSQNEKKTVLDFLTSIK